MIWNKIIYLCLLFLSTIFVYFYGGKVPYMLFFTALMLPILSFTYTIVIYFRFKFFQQIDKKFIIKGDNINYIFMISNEDIFFYPYLSITFFGAESIFAKQFETRNLSLPPLDKKTFTFNLSCKYSGNYEIGVDKIEIEDFLGILKLTYKVPFPLSITVYPRVIILDRFRLKTDFVSESYSVLNSKYEDIGALQDIRKYEYGDSLKKVHWKLTAKLNEIMIRKFQSATEASAIVLLDLKKNNYSFEQNTIIEDMLIESTISVIHYCLYSWIPVNFIYYTNKITDIRANTPFEFQNIYNNLAEIRFSDSYELSEILDVYIKNSIVKTNLLIFTSNLNYDLYNNIYYAAFSGFNTIVVYISPEDLIGRTDEETENILLNIPKIGAYFYRLNINDEIKPVLER
jgi:hypothetical protein